jgi:hypothetical protein
MLRFFNVGVAVLLLALFATSAAAQSTTQNSGRDPLWNGALIGAAAGVGSMAALDAVFCDNGFGGCDTPWKGYLTLGLVGAAAGAGIDALIGRNASGRPSTLRLSPIIGPAHKGLRASLRLPPPDSLPPLLKAQDRPSGQRRDSVWNGALIGAAIGAASGFVWSREECGWNDDECAVYTGLVGIPVGTAIGAAAGAIADALR